MMKKLLCCIVCVLVALTAAAQSADTPSARSGEVVIDGMVKQLSTPPKFKKQGFDRYCKWVFSRVHYPVELKASRIEGMVLMKVIIETDGSVSVGEVLRSPSPVLTETVAEVVRSSPKWTPGLMRDEVTGEEHPVRVSYTLPVDFKFQDPALGGNVTNVYQENKNLRTYGSN